MTVVAAAEDRGPIRLFEVEQSLRGVLEAVRARERSEHDGIGVVDGEASAVGEDHIAIVMRAREDAKASRRANHPIGRTFCAVSGTLRS